jgi:hypothetical protein
MPRRQRQQQDAVKFVEPNVWFSEEEDDNFFTVLVSKRKLFQLSSVDGTM